MKRPLASARYARSPGRVMKASDRLAGGHQEAMDHAASHAHSADVATSRHEVSGGIEWEDDMVDVNRATTPANMRWKLIDRTTGAENHAIDWHFSVGGDQVKIRLVNEMDSDHPMHHPFHIHGAGRFLVLGRAGTVEPNLVWKDTVLVRTGETIDILLDVTNPGVWDGALPHRRAPRERVHLQRRRLSKTPSPSSPQRMGATP